MHSDVDLPPDHQDPAGPDHRDPAGPDGWSAPAGPEPDARPRGPRIAALTLTALIALGAGAGAVYIYQHGLAGSTPTASPSNGSTAGPGRMGGGTVAGITLLGPVKATGRDFIIVGGATTPEIRAQVTNATQFTGSARSLAQVHVGDTAAVQISESNGIARVVSLQDPATAA